MRQIYKSVNPLKICSLHHLAPFNHHWHSLFFFVPIKGLMFTKEGVDQSVDKL